MMIPFLLHTDESSQNFKRISKLRYLKFSMILLLIGITACDKIPSGPVDRAESEIMVKNISAPLGFVYTRTDSTMPVAIEFYDTKSISNVWISIESIDGELNVAINVRLLDNGNPISGDQASGDNIYSALVPISKTFISGQYVIDFYAEYNLNEESVNVIKLGSHVFSYDNGQANKPPVISDLNMPASVDREQDFVFSVNASDPNGKSDITQVYFTLYRPDSTIVNPQNGYNYFLMDL